MNDPIREQLIGYVLGALDEHEQEFVERQLESDPSWRRELQAVCQCLEPLAECTPEEESPPPDLVQKTCMFVSRESQRRKATRPNRDMRVCEGGFESRDRWTLTDWTVMSGICLAAAMLFFPALLNSRFSSRVAACQNNLRELGVALTDFSNASPEGLFPAVATTGNRAFAGIYAPQLQDSGLLRDARLVLCPESRVAESAKTFRVPTLREIDDAIGAHVLILQQSAGGTYAYSLGFVCNGKHMPARNLGRQFYAIMADAPTFESGGQPAHGRGVNFLYEDLHIQFVCEQQYPPLSDNPFCNHFGRCEAGVDVNDAVVAPSYFPPMLTNVSLAEPRK